MIIALLPSVCKIRARFAHYGKMIEEKNNEKALIPSKVYVRRVHRLLIED